MTQEAGYFCQRNRSPFDLIKPGYQKNKPALTAKKKQNSRTVTSVQIKIYWLNFFRASKINVLLKERQDKKYLLLPIIALL